MKKDIRQLINSLNFYFDKTHYVIKKRRNLNSLERTLIYNSEKYKDRINTIQELYSSKKTRVKLHHRDYELVACSIAAKGLKYASFGTSHRLLPLNSYVKPTRILLRSLGEIGKKSSQTTSTNIVGKCAEIKAVNNIYSVEPKLIVTDISFTKAIRPRTMEKISRCENCTYIFGDENK